MRRRALVASVALLCAALPAASGAEESFDDPFAYCRAVGTIDAPDARYKGPALPESIVRGLMKAFGAPADAPLAAFERGTSWRCMDGTVYACNVGANLPCTEKPDPDPSPTDAMRSYCAENPDSDFIPMYVTGHATIYSWSCAGKEPRRGARTGELDPRGYIASIWHRIPPPG